MEMSAGRFIVEVIDEVDTQFDFDVEALLAKALQAAAIHEGIVLGEVVLTLADDETIRDLNRTYRDKDAATDVLSFAIQETAADEPDILFDEEAEIPLDPLGDIVISVPTAIRQAAEYGHSIERELAFLAVHGFLHLIGYDHMTEADENEMFGTQETILAGIGLARG